MHNKTHLIYALDHITTVFFEHEDEHELFITELQPVVFFFDVKPSIESKDVIYLQCNPSY